jgi:signal peptidase I
MYEFSSRLLILTFIGEVCLISIYDNSLESLMCYNTGPMPGIVYRIILDCYIYLIPIIPNIGIYLSVIINIVLPVLLFLRVNKLNYTFEYVSKKRVSISKKYITIPIMLIFVILVSLVSGIFKYKMIAVGSNSMLPNIAKGDAVIYEKVTSITSLKEQDVLVFNNEGTIYVHRINEISKEGNEIIIYTKGDNNADVDSFVTSEEDIIGVVKLRIKYIGYPTVLFNQLF